MRARSFSPPPTTRPMLLAYQAISEGYLSKPCNTPTHSFCTSGAAAPCLFHFASSALFSPFLSSCSPARPRVLCNFHPNFVAQGFSFFIAFSLYRKKERKKVLLAPSDWWLRKCLAFINAWKLIHLALGWPIKPLDMRGVNLLFYLPAICVIFCWSVVVFKYPL